MSLYSKQKKRTTRIGDYIREKREEDEAEAEVPRKRRSKAKRKVIEIDEFQQ